MEERGKKFSQFLCRKGIHEAKGRVQINLAWEEAFCIVTLAERVAALQALER